MAEETKLVFGADVNNLIDGLKRSTVALEEFKKKEEATQKALDDLFKGDQAGRKKFEQSLEKQTKSLNNTEKASKGAKEEVIKLAKAGDKVNGKGTKNLNDEIDKTSVKAKTAGDNVNKNFSEKLKGGFKGVGASIKSAVLGPIGLLIGAGVGLVAVFKQAIGVQSEFQQSLAGLQAITGVSTEELQFYREQAQEIAKDKTLSTSLTETVNAFKLVGSAKPELLDSKEALAEVTKQAILLSKASGDTLESSVTSLTDTLNQYNLGADQAATVTNALAAGSKFGAAAVPQITDAITKFGVAASSSNINVFESIGAIETLAEKGLQGAEAGTSLRNVFNKLSATDILPKDATDRLAKAGVDIDALSDKNLTLQERIEALKPIQDDANALTAVFGAESKNAAQILIQNTDALADYTEKVQTQGVAQDQARINTETYQGAITRLKNSFDALLSGDGDIVEFFTPIINFITDLIIAFDNAIDSIKPFFTAIGDSFDRLNVGVEDSVDSVGVLTRVFELLSIPIKALLSVIGFLVDIFVDVANATNEYISTSPRLLSTLSSIGSGFRAVGNFISDIPVLFVATKDAIVQIATEIGSIVSNLGSVIGKSLTLDFEGAGKALDDLEKTFANAGGNIQGAFNDTVAKKRKEREEEAIQDEIKLQEKLKQEQIKAQNEAGDAVKSNQLKKTSDKDKERLKLEEDFQKALTKLSDDAEKERLKNLSGEELIEAQKQAQLKGVDDLEASLIEKGKEAFGERFELEKEQLDQLELLRSNAVLNADKKLNELRLQEEKEFQKILEEEQEDSLVNQESVNANKTSKVFEQTETLLVSSVEVDEALSEEEKQKKILDIQIEYAKKRIDLLASTGEVEDTIRANELKKIVTDLEENQKELIDNSKQFSLSKLLNVSEDEAGLIADEFKSVVSNLVDIYKSGIDNQIQESERLVNRIDSDIDAQKSKIEEEKGLAEEGNRNNLEAEEQKLEQLEIQRQSEIEKQEALRVRQEKIDTALQLGSLITASANIFKSLSSLGPVGIALAVASVASMFGAFAQTKLQAKSATQLAKGGHSFGVLEGSTHQSGGINLGNGIEAEGGEAWSIYNRKATRKNPKLIQAFTDSINKDKFDEFIQGFNTTTDISVLPINTDKIAQLDAQQLDTKRKEIVLMGKSAGADFKGIEQRLDRLISKKTYGETATHFIIEESGITKKTPKK